MCTQNDIKLYKQATIYEYVCTRVYIYIYVCIHDSLFFYIYICTLNDIYLNTYIHIYIYMYKYLTRATERCDDKALLFVSDDKQNKLFGDNVAMRGLRFVLKCPHEQITIPHTLHPRKHSNRVFYHFLKLASMRWATCRHDITADLCCTNTRSTEAQ